MNWKHFVLFVLQGPWTRLRKETRQGAGGTKCCPSQRTTNHAGRLQQGPGGPQRQDLCSANTVSQRKVWLGLFCCFFGLPLLKHFLHMQVNGPNVCHVQVGGDRREVKAQRESTRGPAPYSRAQRDGHWKRSSGQEAGGESTGRHQLRISQTLKRLTTLYVFINQKRMVRRSV